MGHLCSKKYKFSQDSKLILIQSYEFASLNKHKILKQDYLPPRDSHKQKLQTREKAHGQAKIINSTSRRIYKQRLDVKEQHERENKITCLMFILMKRKIQSVNIRVGYDEEKNIF